MSTSPLTIGAKRFTVEIATTPDEQERGLMHRKSLAEDKGMLFVFPKEQRIAMWMKDTLISLDMLFIDAQGNIIKIAENTTPESLSVIGSGVPVKAVLELAGGVSKKQDITVGDKVTHAVFASHP